MLFLWSICLYSVVSGGNVNPGPPEKALWNGIQVPPKIFIGNGDFQHSQSVGNFLINDTVLSKYELVQFEVIEETAEQLTLTGSCDCEAAAGATIQYVLDGDAIRISVEVSDSAIWNRIWVSFEKSSVDEAICGGGEQFQLNLAGKDWPIWRNIMPRVNPTSHVTEIRGYYAYHAPERGVGRDPENPITSLAELDEPGSGGAYHTTYYPLPTFLTSAGFAFVGEIDRYSELQFSDSSYNTVYAHGTGIQGKIFNEATMLDLVTKVTQLYKAPPAVPEWTNNGAIIAVQGGTERMLRVLRECQAQGVEVAGLWIQDWSGKVETSFGYRVFWNWKWNATLYPDLDTVVEELLAENIRVNVYMNPYLNVEGDLFIEADSLGFLLKTSDGQSYVQDFGGFFAGTIDLFYEPAVQWYIGIIQRNILDFKFGGFMADFGEYTPLDALTSDPVYAQLTGEERHNLIPSVWSRTVRRALELAGLDGEVVAWMRSGYRGAQGEQVMVWAGDQNVDWSSGDGLPTVIPAALSLGMSGFGLSHSDIGGYTTIDLVLKRSQELLLRWAELAAFTPLMRTHEGNKPTLNEQVYSSNETLAAFARMTKVFKALTPYRAQVIREVTESRLPAMRPLFMHYEDPALFTIDTEYLFGRDLLVAPVVQQGIETATVVLPGVNESWEYLWEDLGFVPAGEATVTAPIGRPPVFFRPTSDFASLFRDIKNIV